MEPTVPASPPLKVEWYRFKDSLSADMAGCDLLISHAGAGSVTEGLRLRKLAEDKHLIATTPGRLADDLRALFAKPPALVPYPEADGTLFPRFLTGVLGLS